LQSVRCTRFSQYDALIAVSTTHSFQSIRRTRFSQYDALITVSTRIYFSEYVVLVSARSPTRAALLQSLEDKEKAQGSSP